MGEFRSFSGGFFPSTMSEWGKPYMAESRLMEVTATIVSLNKATKSLLGSLRDVTCFEISSYNALVPFSGVFYSLFKDSFLAHSHSKV